MSRVRNPNRPQVARPEGMLHGDELVLEARAYRRMSVYRPLVAVGRQEVGYLPGDLEFAAEEARRPGRPPPANAARWTRRGGTGPNPQDTPGAVDAAVRGVCQQAGEP